MTTLLRPVLFPPSVEQESYARFWELRRGSRILCCNQFMPAAVVAPTALQPPCFPFQFLLWICLRWARTVSVRRRSGMFLDFVRCCTSVMALNYEHFRHLLSLLELMRRRPSPQHRAVYDRLWMFLKACGPLDFRYNLYVWICSKKFSCTF